MLSNVLNSSNKNMLQSLVFGFGIVFVCGSSAANGYQVNVLHINEHNNIAATKAIVKVIENFRAIESMVNIHLNLKQVNGGKYNLTKYREDVCNHLQGFVIQNETVHLVLSTTTTELSSHFIRLMLIQSQMFSIHFVPSIIGPPTQTMLLKAARSYGKCNCFPPVLRPNYNLYEFVWPIHFVSAAVEMIVQHMRMTSVAILFDPPYSLSDREVQGLPQNHVEQLLDRKNFRQQMEYLRKFDLNNVFVLGSLDAHRFVIRTLSAEYVKRNFLWIFVTTDDGDLEFCPFNATVLFVNPSRKHSIPEECYYQVATELIYGIRDKLKQNTWPTDPRADCHAYSHQMSRQNSFQMLYDKLTINGRIPMVKVTDYRVFPSENELVTEVHNMSVTSIVCHRNRIVQQRELAQYVPHTHTLHVWHAEELSNLSVIKIYRVSIVLRPPFVIHDSSAAKGYVGYCIDVIDSIAAEVGFDYEITESAKSVSGSLLANGTWTGVMADIVSRRVHIGLGALSVMAERAQFIDFTVSFYEMIGIAMMMNIPKAPDDTFRFIRVMDTDVWLGIAVAYSVTSLMVWLTERNSPFGYENDKWITGKKRIFNCKESFWFCLMCLMPQGGGRAPKSLSARIITAAWWMFGFIFVATYTANLASFLTLNQLEAGIESLEDLSQQSRFQYAPMPDSFVMKYFERMAGIEERFSKIWMSMAMNDSLSPAELRKNVVWQYPLSDTYTKLWHNIKKTKLPASLDEAAQRVQNSSISEFVYLGDVSDIEHLVLKYCGLQMVGEEIARRPFAFGLQKGSPLKDQFDEVILKLLSNRTLDALKLKWWDPAGQCKQATDFDGISVTNIGAFFFTILLGIGLALLTLVAEYFWFKTKRKAANCLDVIDSTVTQDMASGQLSLESVCENSASHITVVADVHHSTMMVQPIQHGQTIKRIHTRRVSFRL